MIRPAGRYGIPLEEYGVMFFQTLINLGISNDPSDLRDTYRATKKVPVTDAVFAYQDLHGQIIDAISDNRAIFLGQVGQNLPKYTSLKSVSFFAALDRIRILHNVCPPNFMVVRADRFSPAEYEYVAKAKILADAFSDFALAIYTQIDRYIGIESGYDYLPDGVTLSDMLICKTPSQDPRDQFEARTLIF